MTDPGSWMTRAQEVPHQQHQRRSPGHSSSKDGQVEANLGHPEGLRARVPRQDTRAALAQGEANNLDLPHLYNLEKDPNETANLATVSRRTRRALMRRVWSRRRVWKQAGQVGLRLKPPENRHWLLTYPGGQTLGHVPVSAPNEATLILILIIIYSS